MDLWLPLWHDKSFPRLMAFLSGPKRGEKTIYSNWDPKGAISDGLGESRSLNSWPVFFAQYNTLCRGLSCWASQPVLGLCLWRARQSCFLGWIPSAPNTHVRLTQQFGFPGTAWVRISLSHSLHHRKEKCWTFMEQSFSLIYTFSLLAFIPGRSGKMMMIP